jgi:hypothetical protein
MKNYRKHTLYLIQMPTVKKSKTISKYLVNYYSYIDIIIIIIIITIIIITYV